MISKKHFRYATLIAIVLVLWYLVPIIFYALSPWRAVFLDNGQVYFGKMSSVPFSKTITLKSVYYINANKGASQDIVLSKLIDDVHGPSDVLKISKTHILYYETLRSNSNLVKAIQDKSKQ
jgi:hypothetical protein